MTRYESGARAERRAKEELEQDGWLVTRSAGSKGPFDLVALKIRLIQVKSVKEPQAWTGELEGLSEQMCEAQGVSRELWVWNQRCGWDKHKM